MKAQTNLVSNSSFETFTACPTGGAQWNRCSNWNNVNMNLGIGGWGTPDFYTACGTGDTAPPAVFSGTCTPRTGNSMMGLSLFNTGVANCREFLSCPLSCSMFPGNTYTVSFWLNNGTYGSPYSIRNIGVCFSAGALAQSACAIISATPQCEIVTNVFSTVWVQYTFTITPTNTWNTLTLGAFRTDAQNNVTQERSSHSLPTSFYAYYFIEDIQVLTSTIPVTVTLASSVTQATSCASKGSATIVPSNTNVSMSYYWIPGGQTTPTVGNLSSGIYTVNGSYQNSCGIGLTNQTISIQNPFMPIFSLSASAQTLCTNGTLTINAIVTGGSPGPYSYTWFGSPGTSQFTVTNIGSGLQTLSATAAGANGCAAEATISAYFYQAPGVLSIPAKTICAGAATTLSASSIYAQNYLWSTSQTVPVIYVSPILSTVYTLTGSIGQCSTVSQVSVIVSPLPVINLITSSITCFGANNGSASVSFTNGVPPYQITWSTSPVQTGSVASGLSPGNFLISVGDALNCGSSQWFSIQQPPILTLSASANPSIQCTGNSSSLITSVAGGIGTVYSYSWNNGATTASQTVLQNSAGNYNYIIQVMDINGCTIQKTLTVNYNSPPSLTVSGQSTLCSFNTITVTAYGASGYTWSTGQQGSQISVLPLVSSSYSVVGNSAIGNCTSSAIHFVTVSTVPLLTVTGPTLICQGETAMFSATGADSYSWSTGNSGPVLSFLPLHHTIITLTGTNGSICQSSTQFSLMLTECIGLNENQSVEMFAIYPNPVQEGLILEVKSSLLQNEIESLVLCNSIGQTVLNMNRPVFLNSRIYIPVNELPAGIYFLRCSGTNWNQIRNFIKD